ncbi:MAG TPA: glycosyltransferase family 39 protein [Streptosporangiaceae bacterium]
MPEQDLPVTIAPEDRSVAESQAQAAAASGRWRAVAGWPWYALIPAAVTFGLMLYKITRPSLWQDEVSTLADTHRTLPQLFALLGHIDAVHGAYYVLMWFVIRVAGTGELAIRFPSAVAMAVAAGSIGLLGKRLVSGRAGLAAGLVFAAIPQVTWYGQNAREYALTAAVGTIASYLLVRAVQAPPGARRGSVTHWMIGYGVSLAVLGLLNLFALLLIPAHGLTLAVLARRDAAVRVPGASGSHPDATARPLARGWLIAALAALVASSPEAYFGWTERAQVGWIARPDMQEIVGLTQLIGPSAVFIAVLIIIAAGIVVSAARGRTRLRAEWPQRLVALCVPWLVLPPAVLLAASLAHPGYLFRYIVFCIPAAALLVGTALAALGRAAGTLALVVIVLLVLPSQQSVRGPKSHENQNLRAVSQFVADHAHRGDSVLFASFYERKIAIAYPAGFRTLRDISLGESAAATSEPVASNAPTAVISKRLGTVSRVWLIRRLGSPEPVPPGAPPGFKQVLPPLGKLGFKLAYSRAVSKYSITLYVRSAP